eukprot:scaffold17052_cov114-Isochrysis_galbana.AAC.3
MRRDTLLSPGRLALPPFSPPPFTVSPGARPIISGMHGCGGGTGPVSSDVGGVLSAEDAGEGFAHGGARSSGGEREGVAEGAPTAPRVDVSMTALGASDVGYGYRTGARGWEAEGEGGSNPYGVCECFHIAPPRTHKFTSGPCAAEIANP